MSQSQASVEVKSFSKGLVSDLTPLLSDVSTTTELVNWDINKDGSLSVREGLASVRVSEDSLALASEQQSFIFSPESTYHWKNPSGYVDDVVCYIGENVTAFYSRNGTDGVTSFIKYYSLGASNPRFTTIAGKLIVTGMYADGTVTYFEFVAGVLTRFLYDLNVNDLVGVEETVDKYNRLSVYAAYSSDVSKRNYNHMNTGFTTPMFWLMKLNVSISPHAYSSYLTGFDAANVFSEARVYAADEKRGAQEPPKGKAVIPLIDRGAGRRAFINSIATPTTTVPVPSINHLLIDLNDLPLDKHTGGDMEVEAHQGRVFYGFSGWTGEGTDKNTLVLDELICYSKSILNATHLGECHTSSELTGEDNVILDTDGGYINIGGTGGIISMVSTGTSLLVFGNNGIWSIETTGAVFTPDTYNVRKLSNSRVSDPETIIVHGSSVTFFSESGIETAVPSDRTGYYSIKSISDTILSKRYADFYRGTNPISSVYDEASERLYWFYATGGDGADPMGALIYDIPLGAYYEYDFLGEANIYTVSKFIYTGTDTANPLMGIKGLKITASGGDSDPRLFADEFTFTEPKATSLVEATLTTNVGTFGDGAKTKYGNYLTAYLRQTEKTQDATGLIDTSSCLMRVAWDFSDNISSNKYSREFEAYRLARIAVSAGATYTHGHDVIRTRNKVRGSGHALALKIRSVAGKHCHLYGIGLDITATTKT